MHENVDVRNYYVLFMSYSNSHDLLRSTPGITPPDALDTGNCTGFLGPFLDSARIECQAVFNQRRQGSPFIGHAVLRLLEKLVVYS